MIDENIFKNMYKKIMNIKDEPQEEDLFMCSNCKDIVPEDYGVKTIHDGFICNQCIEDGYGQ